MARKVMKLPKGEVGKTSVRLTADEIAKWEERPQRGPSKAEFGRPEDKMNAIRALERNAVEGYQDDSLGYGHGKLNKGQFGPSSNPTEDKMIQMLDDKQVLGELLEEVLPIYKRTKKMKNADEILSAYQGVAARSLVRPMFFGSHKEVRQSAKEVLDRVLGKPIERQMRLTANVDAMSEAEIDNELRRLKAAGIDGGYEEAEVEVIVEERTDIAGDHGGSVEAEPNTEAVSGVEGEDTGSDLCK